MVQLLLFCCCFWWLNQLSRNWNCRSRPPCVIPRPKINISWWKHMKWESKSLIIPTHSWNTNGKYKKIKGFFKKNLPKYITCARNSLVFYEMSRRRFVLVWRIYSQWAVLPDALCPKSPLSSLKNRQNRHLP